MPSRINNLNHFLFAKQKPSIITYLSKEHMSEQMKKSTYLNIALSCFVFALCFAGIPLYRTFCEHTGLVGDTTKKEYTFDGSKSIFFLN